MLNPYLANGSAADFDFDGQVNIFDLATFSMEWLASGVPPFELIGDLYPDAFVNFRDYAVFLDGHFSPVPMSGDLLLLQLNGNGAATTMANISLNLTRGGIVLEDASLATTVLPTQITVIVPEPATLFLLTLGGLFLRRK
jgi:hypothetical protein